MVRAGRKRKGNAKESDAKESEKGMTEAEKIAAYSGPKDGRGPLPTAPAKLAAATLICNAAAFVYVQAVVERTFIPPGAFFTLVSLALAWSVLRGSRWAPALGAGWFVLLVAISVPLIANDLANPAALHKFAWSAVVLLNAVLGIASGIWATAIDSDRRTR